MRLVIIESPYAGDIERNLKYLDACIRDCLSRGESPYASHRMLTSALRDAVYEERALGMRAGFAWRAAAVATVVYADLGLSGGMKEGMRLGVLEVEKFQQGARERPHYVEVRYLGGEWTTNGGRRATPCKTCGNLNGERCEECRGKV